MQLDFDPQEIIAKYIFRNLDEDVTNNLLKIQNQPPQVEVSRLAKIPKDQLKDATSTKALNLFRQKALVSDYCAGVLAVLAVTAGPLTLAGLAAIGAAAFTLSKRAQVDLNETEAMIMIVLHYEGRLAHNQFMNAFLKYGPKYYYDMPTENELIKSLRYLVNLKSLGNDKNGNFYLKEHVEISI